MRRASHSGWRQDGLFGTRDTETFGGRMFTLKMVNQLDWSKLLVLRKTGKGSCIGTKTRNWPLIFDAVRICWKFGILDFKKLFQEVLSDNQAVLSTLFIENFCSRTRIKVGGESFIKDEILVLPI